MGVSISRSTFGKTFSENYFHCLFVVLLFGLLIIPAISFGQVSDLSVDGYSLVGSKRTGRTLYEYSYRVNVKNNSSTSAEQMTGTVSSNSPYVKVIDPHVVIGNIVAGGVEQSADVFIIQVNRRYPFSTSSLEWTINTGPELVGIEPVPNEELTEVLDIIGEIPREATVEQMSERLEDILHGISIIPRRDIWILREAISELRKQPNIVVALSHYYESLENTSFDRRQLVIGVMGELQQQDALHFLYGIVSKPLSEIEPVYLAMTARDYEETIQVKAVHGIGFIRNDEGNLDADSEKALILIMRDHESEVIRVAAINTYMWNHGDTADAAAVLYQALPADYHKYVQRPRFYAGANRFTFERQLQNWEKEWTQ